MLIELLTIVAPVFVMTGIGYLWARLGRRFDMETIGSLVLYIGTPCLIYSSFTSLEVEPMRFGRMAAAALIALIVAAVLAMLVLRAFKLPFGVFLSALMHPNSGNVGIPVVFLAFGDDGLVLAVSYFFIIALSQYTVGFAIASGRLDVRQILSQPLIWAVLIWMATVAVGLQTPQWILRTTEVLGGITIPLMLVLLGVSLAQLKARDLVLSFNLTLVRIGVGAIAAATSITLLGLTGTERGAAFLLAVMPAGIFNFVFAERFGREPDKVASLIFVSTLLIFVLMPALVWIALRLAGQ